MSEGHKHELAVEFQEAVHAWKSGPAAGEKSLSWGARCLEETAEAVHAAAQGWDGDRDQLEAQATKVVLQLFDDVIVPYDIPGIGAMTETWLEMSLRAALPGVVAAAFDRAPKAA